MKLSSPRNESWLLLADRGREDFLVRQPIFFFTKTPITIDEIWGPIANNS